MLENKQQDIVREESESDDSMGTDDELKDDDKKLNAGDKMLT